MKQKLSLISLFVCIVFMLWMGLFFYPKWEKSHTEATISWDVSGYYIYLPAFFIYKDYKKLNWHDSILENYVPTTDLQQAFKYKNGNYVFKYPIGQSILMSPFFAIGHAIAKKDKQFVADGYSQPYQKSLGMGMLLYSFLGLILFRRFLLLHFSDKVVAICLLFLVFGTNYLNYAAIEQAQTHATLFMLYSALLLVVHSFYKKNSIAKALLIGLLIGFMTIVRPTELLAVLIPFLYQIKNVGDILQRIMFFLKNYKFTFLIIVGIFSMLFIQLFYWKMAGDAWLVYSYQDQGFSWLHPHLKNYLFSARSGWLRYCPLPMLAYLGLIFIPNKNGIKILSFVFVFIFSWIVTAWDIWWFGGRAMIQSYPILFIGMAALIQFLFNKKSIKYIFYFIALVFIYLNLWWTYFAHRPPIQVLEISDAYWQAVVGKWDATESTKALIDNADQQQENKIYETKIVDSLFQKEQYLSAQDIKFTFPISSKKKLVRFIADVKINEKEWDVWKMPRMQIVFFNNEQLVQYNELRINRLMNENERKQFFIDAKIPKTTFNKVNFIIANSDSKKKISVFGLRILEAN